MNDPVLRDLLLNLITVKNMLCPVRHCPIMEISAACNIGLGQEDNGFPCNT